MTFAIRCPFRDRGAGISLAHKRGPDDRERCRHTMLTSPVLANSPGASSTQQMCLPQGRRNRRAEDQAMTPSPTTADQRIPSTTGTRGAGVAVVDLMAPQRPPHREGT